MIKKKSSWRTLAVELQKILSFKFLWSEKPHQWKLECSLGNAWRVFTRKLIPNPFHEKQTQTWNEKWKKILIMFFFLNITVERPGCMGERVMVPIKCVMKGTTSDWRWVGLATDGKCERVQSCSFHFLGRAFILGVPFPSRTASAIDWQHCHLVAKK